MKAQKEKFGTFETEREAMIRKIKDLEIDLNKIKLERNQLESEVKVLISEIDQQKSKMEDKLNKLKIALEN